MKDKTEETLRKSVGDQKQTGVKPVDLELVKDLVKKVENKQIMKTL